jgi:hypothetical protein
MFWDTIYKGNNRIWGEEPSAVAAVAVYYFFKGDARQKLRATITKLLKPEGLVFLSTLSPKDPLNYGKGIPVANEHNSFREKVYLHFCTRNELGGCLIFWRLKNYVNMSTMSLIPRAKFTTIFHGY